MNFKSSVLTEVRTVVILRGDTDWEVTTWDVENVLYCNMGDS